jgi:hypothetical protein
MRRPIPLVAVASLLALVLALPAAGRQVPLFRIIDPHGDDRGDGTLHYPRRSDLNPGDLDLVEFSAVPCKDGTVFRFAFARPILQPDRGAIDPIGGSRADQARHGFYAFNIDLYIDTDRKRGSGEVAMLPGRKAVVDEAFAWEKVVALAPRPHLLRQSIEAAKLREWKSEKSKTQSLASADIRRRRRQIEEELIPLIYFPNQVRVRGRRVEALVPREFLGGQATVDRGYVVVVSGALLERRFRLPFIAPWTRDTNDGMIVPVLPGRDQEAFGGGREDPLQPPLIDILAPDGRVQSRVLSDFSSHENRPAKVPGVVPAEPGGPERPSTGG